THKYKLMYSPVDLGAVGPPPPDDLPAEIMQDSLLARAGLQAPPKAAPRERRTHREGGRYDVLDDSAGQIDLPEKPV
ncbi:MAG TPA: hypothetical protein PJ982_16225, partial [Lacipirellulaceae bacterium]|nr:hypothetical protein [Lacipirellulaceae bacterium]